jgi:hypothetical protein
MGVRQGERTVLGAGIFVKSDRQLCQYPKRLRVALEPIRIVRLDLLVQDFFSGMPERRVT